MLIAQGRRLYSMSASAYSVVGWPIELFGTLYACIIGAILWTRGYWLATQAARTVGQATPPLPKLSAASSPFKLSIIIPCYNESATIARTLARCDAAARDRKSVEIIVVDGSPGDQTMRAAEAAAAALRVGQVSVRKASRSGRAAAQNEGAAAAQGDVLLFLHADTVPPTGYDTLIESALTPATLGGGFSFAVDRSQCVNGKPPVGMGTIEWWANLRSRSVQLPYGDQGLFLRRERFQQLGGFPDVVMMEDFEFVGRMRAAALRNDLRVVTVEQPALCSPRRWEANGCLLNTVLNQVFVFCYTVLGMTDRQIYRLYYGHDLDTRPLLESKRKAAREAAQGDAPQTAVEPCDGLPTGQPTHDQEPASKPDVPAMQRSLAEESRSALSDRSEGAGEQLGLELSDEDPFAPAPNAASWAEVAAAPAAVAVRDDAEPAVVAEGEEAKPAAEEEAKPAEEEEAKPAAAEEEEAKPAAAAEEEEAKPAAAAEEEAKPAAAEEEEAKPAAADEEEAKPAEAEEEETKPAAAEAAAAAKPAAGKASKKKKRRNRKKKGGK